MTIHFRLAGKSDAARMTDFHNSYYRTRLDPDHWTWLYFGQDFGEPVFAYAEADDGRIVATQGMVPYQLSVEGQLTQSCKSENTLVLPEGRGTGLMSDLYEFAFDEAVSRGSQVTWGFTDSAKAFSRFGFGVHPLAATYIRQGKSLFRGAVGRLRSSGPLRQRFLSAGKHVHGALIRQATPLESSRPPAHQLVILEPAHARSEWSTFQRALSTGIQLSWQASYFDWRWMRNPNATYTFMGLVDGQSVVAIAVVMKGEGRVVISDVKGASALSRLSVVAGLVDYFNASTGAFRLFANLSPDVGISEPNWRDLGFHIDHRTHLVVRGSAHGLATSLEEPTHWAFSFAWSEGVTS